ncbi:tetratricopeptide repeat protein [Sulfurimonas sp.]|uniref:tetratricopeptide repeat protein n=1 Tax=Sulfurimonas sp. TaxID=2022749 RepID=UPI00356812D5
MKDRLLVLSLTTFLFTLVLNADEPSAFGAGDLNNPSPYGLTKEEQLLLQNNQKLKKVTVKSNNQSNELESLRDRIDGIQTIIENLSRKSHENTIDLNKLNKLNEDEQNSSKEFENRLLDISSQNQKEIENLKLIIKELSALIDEINKNYVTKNEFNTLVKNVNSFKDLVSKELKVTNKNNTKTDDFRSQSNAQVAKDAKKNYDKKYYTKAINMYTYLIEKNYKPAYAHYMIGEMKYYRKNYSDAIAYFKKSAELYSKASYMPTLMYHTAFAMKYTGDNKNAKTFFRALITKYPNSKYISEAKKQVELIK